MLNLVQVTLRRGVRVLFENVTVTVHAGQKIGVTGANGSGKSSLFALILGELQPDAGDLQQPARLAIAHVAQETPSLDRAAIEYVIDGDAELRDLEARLAAAEAGAAHTELGEAHAALEAAGGLTARRRAARLMRGLGFSHAQEATSVQELSGGWRMRLNLAQALMCRSDLLLLDEPTNHLDLDAVLWLEGWLRSYPGTLLLISHDRDFLDNVVKRVLHIDATGIESSNGNYSAFERRRAATLALRQAEHVKQQAQIRHMQRFVDRFRYKASKARQAQSRLKALERMETIAPAHVDSPFQFAFPQPDKLPRPLVHLDAVAAGYGEHEVLHAVSLSLLPGDRIGLLGPNGAGKSTLIKVLAGTLAPEAGEVEHARDLAVGYFAQHQLDQLQHDASPLEHLRRASNGNAREQELRDFLGGFGFSGERIREPVVDFSGGEKARLVLALLVYARPNLLLLDEPTNHLDLEMRHALTIALQEFTGATITVSHDRHLLRTTCDTLMLVSDGGVAPFQGDLEDYARWLARGRNQARDPDQTPQASSSARARKERRRQEAAQRQRLSPLRKRLKGLESELAKMQRERKRIEGELADPALYEPDGHEKGVGRLLRESADAARKLEELERGWIEVSEELDAVQRSLGGKLE